MAEDTIQTSVRLSPDNHEWLRRAAYDRKVSQNQILNDLIDAERDDDQPKEISR